MKLADEIKYKLAAGGPGSGPHGYHHNLLIKQGYEYDSTPDIPELAGAYRYRHPSGEVIRVWPHSKRFSSTARYGAGGELNQLKRHIANLKRAI